MPEKPENNLTPKSSNLPTNEFGGMASHYRIQKIVGLSLSGNYPFDLQEWGIELSGIIMDVRSGKSLTEEQKRFLEILSGRLIAEGMIVQDLFKNSQ